MSAEECCENCKHYPDEFPCLVKDPNEEVGIIDYKCADWVHLNS